MAALTFSCQPTNLRARQRPRRKAPFRGDRVGRQDQTSKRPRRTFAIGNRTSCSGSNQPSPTLFQVLEYYTSGGAQKTGNKPVIFPKLSQRDSSKRF